MTRNATTIRALVFGTPDGAPAELFYAISNFARVYDLIHASPVAQPGLIVHEVIISSAGCRLCLSAVVPPVWSFVEAFRLVKATRADGFVLALSKERRLWQSERKDLKALVEDPSFDEQPCLAVVANEGYRLDAAPSVTERRLRAELPPELAGVPLFHSSLQPKDWGSGWQALVSQLLERLLPTA